MPDHHYDNPRLARLYDMDSPWSPDRDFYLSLAGKPPWQILDLGCGTGLLCDAYAAKGHKVTGVDPARSMLDVAREKPHGRNIEWIESSAQDYRADKRFDLIIMTGHAFQVLLAPEDIGATFNGMKRHIKPGGLIVFETRNPQIDWAEKWNYEMALDTPAGVVHESRKLLSFDGQQMTFELRYRFAEEELVSASTIRFWSKQEIEGQLLNAGLYADTILGDWSGAPFNASSEEMIFKVRGH